MGPQPHKPEHLGLIGDDRVGKNVGLDDVGKLFVGKVAVVGLGLFQLAFGHPDGCLNLVDLTLVLRGVETKSLKLHGQQVRGLVRGREKRVGGGAGHPDPGVAAVVALAQRLGAVNKAPVLRVQVVHVIELTEVIKHCLPVAVDRYRLVLHQGEVAKLVVIHDRDHVLQKLLEGFGVGIEVDPVEPECLLAAHLGQADRLFGQAVLKPLLMGGIDQVAIGAIAPAVIGAAKVFPVT